MSYNIKFDDITSVQVESQKTINAWGESVASLNKVMTDFINNQNLQGQAISSMRNYLVEVHGTLLQTLVNLMNDYSTNLLLYKDGYYQIDGDLHTKLPSQVFTNLHSALKGSRDDLKSEIELLNTTKDKISDLVSYDGSSHTSTVMDYNFLLNQIKNLDSSITQYESNHASQDLVAFKELLAATKALIAEHAGKTRTVGTYQSGDFAKLKSVQRFAIAYRQATQQMGSRVERVKAAQERDKVRFEALARSDKGWQNWAIGGLTIIAGVAAIIFTLGSATPLVVAGGIVGLGTTAYGVSNMYEAGQDIKLGNAGDIQTKAGNPIRDTLFMGNDKLYHDVGNVFTTASAIMIPIGQTGSVVKGLTQFAIGEAGAYTAGQVAYHGTKLLGGSEEDAQTANFIGNLVGGYAASSAASKFSLNKVKVDVEAPKYNREQILKNLEESRLARESSNFDQYLAKEKFQKTLMSMEPMDRQRYLQWHEYAESGIMVQDRVKLLSWERPVNSKLYLENKAVYDNPKYFDQLTGNENWPGQKGDPNIDGFLKGEYQKTTLSPGDKIDRFGSDYGHFFGNIGESKEMRAMSPNSDFKNYNQYEILMDLPVLKGKIAPWFNQPGGGIQFKLDPFFAKQIMSIPSDEAAIIKKLIEFGYLRKL
ncbi:hypothetical protein DF217_02100 [Streptococcus oralis]|uniref:LXG domain-containing protein n=3 Tax=Streptococcus oralis TaxID=1303 RepID=A0A4Q2FTM2_STROR|nr:glycohydrolase toxin TNT-related protein [Streptococcus oralis]RXX22786.1 hypothetical protein DF217_02100 [Streptococcus oralis]